MGEPQARVVGVASVSFDRLDGQAQFGEPRGGGAEIGAGLDNRLNPAGRHDRRGDGGATGLAVERSACGGIAPEIAIGEMNRPKPVGDEFLYLTNDAHFSQNPMLRGRPDAEGTAACDLISIAPIRQYADDLTSAAAAGPRKRRQPPPLSKKPAAPRNVQFQTDVRGNARRR